MQPLIARLTTDHAIHELVREAGSYVLKTYAPAPSCERTLTLEEAGEWLEVTRRCGGESFGRLERSPKTCERTQP